MASVESSVGAPAPGALPRAAAPTRPVARGRLLNLAHLAILLACFWTFICLAIAYIDMSWAGMAVLPDLHISAEQMGRWIEYEQSHGKRLPETERWLADVRSRENELMAHYRQVRDGHAFLMTCSLMALALLVGVTGIVIGSYVFEGLQARRINAGASPELILDEARAALPADFPRIGLRIARATFLRYRLREGLTAYLHDALFVFLRGGHAREFRFVLTHELFHVRCFDPWFNAVAKAFRRFLVVMVSFAFFLAISNELTFYVNRWFWITVPLGLFLSYRVGRYLLRFDAPFLMHKELLADGFAAARNPGADVSLVYRNPTPPPRHPAVGRRIGYLLSGASDTACRAFFAPQELLAFCIVCVPALLDEPVWIGPKLGLLPFPGAALALAGSAVMAFEAWRTPIPGNRRRAMLARGVAALVICAVITLLSRPYFWFAYAQLALIGAVMLRIATAASVPEPDAPGVAVGRVTRASRRPGRVVGLVLSWYAIVYAVSSLSLGLAEYAAAVLFRRDVSFFSFAVWPEVVNVASWIAVIPAAARNVKRPAGLSLVVEWLFYATGIHGFVKGGIWFFGQLWGKSSIDFTAAVLQLPWSDMAKLRAAGLGDASLRLVILVTIIPQLITAWFYFVRLRAVIAGKRRERSDARAE